MPAQGDGATPPCTDAELAERCRKGDTEAFRELFDRKHRGVYLIAYQILGDSGRAEDVAQEVFLRLWDHFAEYRRELPIDGWLRRIATNRAIDHWRSGRAERARRVDPPPGADPDARLEAAAIGTRRRPADAADRLANWERLQAIWDELAATLPPQQRAAFVLREIEGATSAEVADILGCRASTVRSHVAEARAKLQAALAERYPELLPEG